MFKVGDKIMICGFEEWGEGEIKEERHGVYGDVYVTYFPNKNTSLTSCSQKNFYQTLKQQIVPYLSKPLIMYEPTKPIIFTTSKVDDKILKTFSETKGKIEGINKPNHLQAITDLWRFLRNNAKFEFKNGSAILSIQDNDNTYRSPGRGLKFDYTFIDEIDLNEFFKNYINNKGDFLMPNITNYKYTEDTAVTTIEWSDGTKTTVRAEYPETASPYTGFVTACAKKAFGNNNTINKLFDEWAVKKPAREIKAKIKSNAAELEAKRIAEKHKAKREKWLIRKRAAEINREYEARKLANEKYGVPMDKEEV